MRIEVLHLLMPSTNQMLKIRNKKTGMDLKQWTFSNPGNTRNVIYVTDN